MLVATLYLRTPSPTDSAYICAMKMLLRPAVDSDIPAIAQLADRIWKIHYTPIIGEKQVAYMLDKMYSAKSLHEQMQKGDLFFLATMNDVPFGYISLSKKEKGDYFLNKFYIEVNEQGKGYGKQIFADILERFPDLEQLRLQVNRMNYKTINFYFGLGFTIEYAKDFDIGDGYRMDDYVMVWKRPKA